MPIASTCQALTFLADIDLQTCVVLFLIPLRVWNQQTFLQLLKEDPEVWLKRLEDIQNGLYREQQDLKKQAVRVDLLRKQLLQLKVTAAEKRLEIAETEGE